MISVRRAALLGLTTPLTAIMVAVLGLWPEPQEPLFELPRIVSGGDNSQPDHFEIDRKNRERDEAIEAQNSMIVSIVTMAITEGML